MDERVSGEGLGQEQEFASPEDAVRYGGAAERGTKIRCAGDIGYTRMPGSIPILYASDDPAEVGLLGSIGVSPPATGRPDTI